ncbi:MAG TPA: HRDC domain-containing protein [Anaerolineales bacterium]|nr:HRDC domain-containing protein [Anaerolineales bacterium]
MEFKSLPKPVMITRVDALSQMVNQLASEAILAVDTESNSLYAYQERVCLIQFSTPQDDFLVDPLALDDLTPLEALFADDKIEKIFHAAEYDLISMKRDFQFRFENLFDTMIAARILGWEQIGLGSILKAEFDVELNKRYQRANWGKRPIPAEMMAYARLDTHYLIPLRFRLKSELMSQNRWPLAEEDFARLRYVNGRDPHDLPEPCWRVRGAYDLAPQQAAVLLELCRYRSQVAKSINRPVFKVISDQTLIAIAEICPRSKGALEKLPELSVNQYQRHGPDLLRAVETGLKAEPVYPPRSPRPDELYLARVEELRNWRKRTAKQAQVKSDVILPRDVLYEIAARDPNGQDELAEVMEQLPWRLEQYGDQILATLSDL